MSYQIDLNKLLFWKKMYTSDDLILYSLSRLTLNRFAAVVSQYGIVSILILQPVAVVKLAIRKLFAGDNFHAYANDSQLYVHCNRCDMTSAAARLEHCITDVGHWMSANCLKLNADKTELLWAGIKQPVTFRRQ